MDLCFFETNVKHIYIGKELSCSKEECLTEEKAEADRLNKIICN